VSFEFVRLPYVDTEERAVCGRADQCRLRARRPRPIIFDTIIDQRLRQILAGSAGSMFDIFTTFLAPLERAIGTQSSFTVGASTGPRAASTTPRIEAVHYAMANDDGASGSEYQKADVILIGVSRSGKTPRASIWRCSSACMPQTIRSPTTTCSRVAAGIAQRLSRRLFG